MCGITGIFAFNLVGKFNKINVTNATMALEKRGPDVQDIHLDEWVALGHRRLSIIDTTSESNQPMWDDTGRYGIVFNGEIFNYREIKEMLLARGVTFRTTGDTEVLLKLYIVEKEKCLRRLNGFFSFCVYDRQEQQLFVARDRYGIKPLYYLFDEDKFLFASELKSIVQYGIDRTIDFSALYAFLQLNYIPAPQTIFKSVRKLLPGHFITVRSKKINIERWYSIPDARPSETLSYDDAKTRLSSLLEMSVQRRLVADVPLGSFLSGGIDSSIIAGLAKRHKSDLHTFSIGYRDEEFFDETYYAKLVAKHFGTDHTVFSLTNDDLYEHLSAILNYTDEPFADSSAIAVYILSKHTRKHATVALSGDGADELFAGYNKHAAALRMLKPGFTESAVSSLGPLWNMLPKSRSNTITNKIRQLHRFAQGTRLSARERYWQWASFASEDEALSLIAAEHRDKATGHYWEEKNDLLTVIPEKSESINDVLRADMNIVLPNDMLMKVDLMSMANSLEVRVPFLDFELVNFAFSLPGEFKINSHIRKKILQDAYRDFLPRELYNRPKKGFEVPLLKWFRTQMRSTIVDDLLSDSTIAAQGIFDLKEVQKLRTQLFSKNPGDSHARIWGLIVFQSWLKKFGT